MVTRKKSVEKCHFTDFLSFIFNYKFWQCLWNRWILIFIFPKQQTATEGVLKNVPKNSVRKSCIVNLRSKSIKIPVKENIFSKIAGLQPACLPKNEFLHIFSKGFKLIFQKICFPDQFPVAATIKHWPIPLQTTGRC